MPTTFLMLAAAERLDPPSGPAGSPKRRPSWRSFAPETMEGAEQAIGHADGAFGRIPPRSWRAPTDCAGCRRRRPHAGPGSTTPS